MFFVSYASDLKLFQALCHKVTGEGPPRPTVFAGPLLNSRSAVVDTGSLAVLSFTLPSQVPYSPIGTLLDASFRPYFVRTQKPSPDADKDDDDMDTDEEDATADDPGALYSGEDTDGEDVPTISTSSPPSLVDVPEQDYIYRQMVFDISAPAEYRHFRKQLADVRALLYQ